MRGAICIASLPRQNGAISSSIANLTDVTARKPKASPQPCNPWSVVTLTSKESAAGRSLSPQAAASELLPALNGIRSGKVSILAMIIVHPSSLSEGDRFRLPSLGSLLLSRRGREPCFADRPSHPCIRDPADQRPLPE